MKQLNMSFNHIITLLTTIGEAISGKLLILFFLSFSCLEKKITQNKNNLSLVLPQTTLRQNSAENIYQIPMSLQTSQVKQDKFHLQSFSSSRSFERQ